MEAKQTKLPKSQIEIEFELTVEEFQKYIDQALEHLKSHVKMDGFRQGQVPAKLAKDRVGTENLLMEAGDIAVRKTYTKYVSENGLEPVGQPDVQIIKIAEGSPFVFKAKITLLPIVELPDYKAIVAKIKSKDMSVTEEELQDALKYLQKSRAKITPADKTAEKKDFVQIEYQNKDINDGKPVEDQFVLGEGGFMKGFEENIEGMKAGDEKEFKAVFPEASAKKELAGKEGEFKVKMKMVHKMEVPEINDQFAKDLGAFETLTALKDSVKEGLTGEKKEAEKQRKRAEILEKIAEKTKVELPDSIVDYEKQRLMDDLKHKIDHHLKVTFEQYLASVKKTEQELKDTFQKEAEKRLTNFMVLKEVGRQEKVEVTDKEVEEEVNKTLKGETLQKAHDEIDINQFREYTKGVLFNEKVFDKLDSYSANND